MGLNRGALRFWGGVPKRGWRCLSSLLALRLPSFCAQQTCTFPFSTSQQMLRPMRTKAGWNWLWAWARPSHTPGQPSGVRFLPDSSSSLSSLLPKKIAPHDPLIFAETTRQTKQLPPHLLCHKQLITATPAVASIHQSFCSRYGLTDPTSPPAAVPSLPSFNLQLRSQPCAYRSCYPPSPSPTPSPFPSPPTSPLPPTHPPPALLTHPSFISRPNFPYRWTAQATPPSLGVGHNRLVHLCEPIASVSLSDPSIADLRVVSPDLIYVFAKKIGTTNIALIAAKPNPGPSNQDKERGPQSPRQSTIRLRVAAEPPSGATSQPEPKSVLEVKVFGCLHTETPKPRLPPPVEVLESRLTPPAASSEQQINIRLRFAEVSAADLKTPGIDWQTFGTGNFSFGLLAGCGRDRAF